MRIDSHYLWSRRAELDEDLRQHIEQVRCEYFAAGAWCMLMAALVVAPIWERVVEWWAGF